MSTLKELNEKRESLYKEIESIDKKLKEMSDIPAGWSVNYYEYSGIAIYGHVWHGEENRDARIYVSGAGVTIHDEEDGDKSLTVPVDAMKAAVKLYEIYKEEKNKEIEAKKRER